MTFLCCENCIVEMICATPCEKFEIETLQLSDLLSFNNCLRLLEKYQYKKFNLKNKINVKIDETSINIYKNDELHRDNGPAIIRADRYKAWYKKGKLHRVDGPAIIRADRYKVWYKKGKLHRVDGPAIIYADGSERWYKNGVKIK